MIGGFEYRPESESPMSRAESLDYRKLPSYKPLFLDYLHRFGALSPFFTGDPFDPAAWRKMATALAGRVPSTSTATPLRALNTALGADELALLSIDALGDGALAVITGQQVGLFGGPLYTLYKALTAVRLARAAEAELQTKVVPLFWMDTDDHDFAEVQSTWILDAANELVELRYDTEDASEKLPVGGRKLTPAIGTVLDEAARSLPDTEFKEDMLSTLGESYAAGRTMAEAFGAWLLRMTRGSGLVIIDPSLPELKALGVAVFARELEEGSVSRKLVQQTTAELVERGYHAQATPSESHLNLFHADPLRSPVTISENEKGNKDELVRRLRDEPSHFSPNVLLRPIYQDTLFPTLAYVAGPNELAYFAQLKGVYEHFDLTMPLIASRASFTVIERPQARFLDRYDVPLAKLSSDDESLLNDIVRGQTPPQLDEDLKRARNCIQDITKALERDLSAVDASLVPTVKSTRGKLLHHLKELETKAFRAVKRKPDTVRQQFLAARTALFPGFDMQERKLSPLGYLNKYGWHFTTMVEEGADPALKVHLLLYP